MKHKIISIILVILLIMACAGCGKQPEQMKFLDEPTVQQSAPGEDKSVHDEETQADALVENPANGEDLFESSNLSGTVIELLNNGCKITPTVTDDNVACEAAPGYEDQQENTTVVFGDDCIFQIAYVNVQTGSVSYEDASENDVKNQTRLLICGEYDSDGVLHADRVFIYRSMG